MRDISFERDLITSRAEAFQRDLNRSNELFAPKDNKSIIIDVRWIVNNIRIVGVDIDLAIIETKTDSIMVRYKIMKISWRPGSPVANKVR